MMERDSLKASLQRACSKAVLSGIALSFLGSDCLMAGADKTPDQPHPKTKPPKPSDLADLADKDWLKPYQTMSLGLPPQSPTEFNPDPNPLFLPRSLFDEPTLTLHVRPRFTRDAPPRPPAVFNPDPGGKSSAPVSPPPFFRTEPSTPPPFGVEPVEDWLALPRPNLRYNELDLEPEPPPEPPQTSMSQEPVPKELALPRERTRRNLPIDHEFHFRDYRLNAPDYRVPPNSEPKPDRWRIGFAPWRRYTSGSLAEMTYGMPEAALWHPYRQSLLKGDVPIIGQDIFLNLTASTLTEFEMRRIPTPSGIGAARSGAAEFFGRSEQFSVVNNFAFAAELFKGETAFKPIKWAVRVQPVFNINYVHAEETGVVSPDPRGNIGGNNPTPPDTGGIINPSDLDNLVNGQLGGVGDLTGKRHTNRTKNYYALQEAFADLHLADLSDNYDFIAVRAGNQVFNSDFRGFIFNDTNLGLRLFGNLGNNRNQYNLAFFDLREKDTNSELNSFDSRNQQVFIANYFRQDFLWKGYTAQLSFHASFDEADTHYDRNGNIVRPAPIGTVREHNIDAYYLGWAGDGHIGRFNVSHAFYQVYGHDDFNGLAGQPTEIDAQMAAFELSYDKDWARLKLSFFYASGDDRAEDDRAKGFDTIIDNPNFTGGPFSFYTRQGFNLAGTSVGLKQRFSLVPNLRTSKTEGQANFVNPGIFIFGVGTELDVTPKLRTFVNVNYLRFVETDPIKTALLTDKANGELGLDCSIGVQYRPLLTDNIVVSAGFGTLLPGRGYRDIYRHSTDPVPGFNPLERPGRANDFLYSGIIAVTFTY